MGQHEDLLIEPVLHAIGASAPDAWWRREVPIEPARADLVAIVRGVLFAVELKSTHDSLARLPSQLAAYAAVADRVVVACAPKHVEGATRCIAQAGLRGVGVLAIDGEQGTWVAEHSPNDARLVWRVARLLHGHELVAMLEARGPDAAKGVRGRSKSQVLRRCDALGVTIDEYHAALLRCWPARDWSIWKKARERVAQRRQHRKAPAATIRQDNAPIDAELLADAREELRRAEALCAETFDPYVTEVRATGRHDGEAAQRHHLSLYRLHDARLGVEVFERAVGESEGADPQGAR